MFFPDQPFIAFFFKRGRDQSHFLVLVPPSLGIFLPVYRNFLPVPEHFFACFICILWVFSPCPLAVPLAVQYDLERIDEMVIYIVECPTPTGVWPAAAAAAYYYLAIK